MRPEGEIREAADLLDRYLDSGRWRSRPENEQNVLAGGFAALEWVLRVNLRGGGAFVTEVLQRTAHIRIPPERN